MLNTDSRQNSKKFIAPRTETAIISVSNSIKYPDLNTPENVIIGIKDKILDIANHREALELLREIDFTIFRPQQFDEVYYYLQNCSFSEEAIDFLDTVGIDVVFIELEGSLPSYLLKVGDVFYSPVIQTIQLKEVDCPFIENQGISFFTGMIINGEQALLRISPEKCTFENYYGEEICLGDQKLQLIKNIYGSYDILNLTTGTLYNFQATKVDKKTKFSLRFFIDNEQTIFIDFDGRKCGEVTRLEKSKEIDLSDADDTTVKFRTH